jgi:NTP pyrophosphatase (non-canonical NTP hydrolase)
VQLGFNDYQLLASRTYNHDLLEGDGVVMAALGLAGEAGEVVELIKKWRFHGKPIAEADLKAELGDVLWYLACMADRYGFRLEDIAAENLAKLEKRWPHKFGEKA